MNIFNLYEYITKYSLQQYNFELLCIELNSLLQNLHYS